ncbi:hypothetical protein FRB94_014688 [Tulasnella sp. JGI-2019a]|nr:hypothetical protein FRB94_014688 [Tulasnella sp. JGI-2019a]KAG8997574.1 hypothetical protein FRB93_014032 [Tulasnella sp. JGI-2019a]
MSQNSGDALVAAAKTGDLGAIQALIDGGAEVDQRVDGVTPMMAAIMEGQEKAATLLAEKGGRLQDRDKEVVSEALKARGTPKGPGQCRLCSCSAFSGQTDLCSRPGCRHWDHHHW